MNLIEERKISRFDTDKMIDLIKFKEKEPILFYELCEDYPTDNYSTLIINVIDTTRKEK